jgi:hypothetical protein
VHQHAVSIQVESVVQLFVRMRRGRFVHTKGFVYTVHRLICNDYFFVCFFFVLADDSEGEGDTRYRLPTVSRATLTAKYQLWSRRHSLRRSSYDEMMATGRWLRRSRYDELMATRH